MKNSSGVSVTSTKGKLEVMRSYKVRVVLIMHLMMIGSMKLRRELRHCSTASMKCEECMLDREIEPSEIARCIRQLKDNKFGGSDGLVGELF